MYGWMICSNWADGWLADTGKIPFPFPLLFLLFFLLFFASSTIGNGTSLQFGVACKQAQPLLEVRFGGGGLPCWPAGEGELVFDG